LVEDLLDRLRYPLTARDPGVRIIGKVCTTVTGSTGSRTFDINCNKCEIAKLAVNNLFALIYLVSSGLIRVVVVQETISSQVRNSWARCRSKIRLCRKRTAATSPTISNCELWLVRTDYCQPFIEIRGTVDINSTKRAVRDASGTTKTTASLKRSEFDWSSKCPHNNCRLLSRSFRDSAPTLRIDIFSIARRSPPSLSISTGGAHLSAWAWVLMARENKGGPRLLSRPDLSVVTLTGGSSRSVPY
jgi:hypothetical protein